MADEASRARAEAIDGFAAALRDLRAAAGNPSFREMSGRSRAISHTTLHEAAQGNRLPSWETTVEFVKACGGDPADYRARWEQASQAVQAAGAQRQVVPERGAITPPATGRVPADAPAVGEAAGPVPDVSDGPTTVEPPAAADPRPGGSRRLRAAIVGVATAAVVAIVVVVVSRSGRGTPNPSARRSSAAALTPTDCPIRRSNPPLAPPAHKGDASTLIVDVTLPDCSHIRRGSTVTKIWRFKNVGTVPWNGYSLHRLDVPQHRNQCQTISDVPIPDTAPGEIVDVQTEVTAPPKPGFCFVRFKMVDAAGAIAFPGRRPVTFQLIVD